jgi:hypothetical protein
MFSLQHFVVSIQLAPRFVPFFFTTFYCVIVFFNNRQNVSNTTDKGMHTMERQGYQHERIA